MENDKGSVIIPVYKFQKINKISKFITLLILPK